MLARRIHSSSTQYDTLYNISNDVVGILRSKREITIVRSIGLHCPVIIQLIPLHRSPTVVGISTQQKQLIFVSTLHATDRAHENVAYQFLRKQRLKYSLRVHLKVMCR